MKLKKIVLVTLLLVLAGCGAKTPDKEVEEPENEVETPVETGGLIDPDASHPVVTLTMENGDVMTLELYPEVAPNTVHNFIDLIQSGFYDGLVFHRVIPEFMIQGGDPQGNGGGGPGYNIKGEFSSNGIPNQIKHERGVLSMARTNNLDGAGSQFFIIHETSPHLDGQYAAFGKVITNLEAIDTIVSVEKGANDRPVVEQKIKSVTVDTLGVDYPKPEVIK